MGIFDNSETYVSSVVYNLAGDENERPDYMKSLVVGNVLTSSQFSMSDTIQSGYLNGPGIRLRSFARWSQGEYSEVMGSNGSILAGDNSLDIEALENEIPRGAGEAVEVQRAAVDHADAAWWADGWMLENRPDDIAGAWSYVVNAASELVITLPDASVETVAMLNYDPSAFYVYAIYSTTKDVWHPPVTDPDTGVVTPGYYEAEFSKAKAFIYKIGTGKPVLDNMLGLDTEDGFYFPPIPVRLANKFLGPDKDQWSIAELPEDATEEQIDAAFKAKQQANPVGTLPTNFDDIYPLAKKAVRRSMGARFDKITNTIAKNVNLDDIDYAYIVFGVPLNTKERASQQYLWDLFHRLYGNQGPLDMELWKAQLDIYATKIAIWRAWKAAGSVGPEPEKPRIPPVWNHEIKLVAQGTGASEFVVNYDVQVRWRAMGITSGSGQGRPDAKKGDLWWVVEPDLEYTEVLFTEGSTTETTKGMTNVTLYRQETDDSWSAISIWDLEHRNWVYGNQAILTRAKDAIEDTTGDSGFIVPLHYATYREMSLIDSTQMATACCYLVLNCYTVVKKKWYQTFAFQVFLIVAMVVFSVVTGGVGGAGLLGSNLGVGTALGFTGTAAAIVGGIANAVAAMLVAKALGYVSVELFGEKVGAIVAAIATLVAMQVGTSMMNGGSLASSFANMARADNLLNLTNSVGQGYAGFLQASAQQIAGRTTDMLEEYAEKTKAVEDAYAANIGHGRGVIDPGTFIGTQAMFVETVDQFLSRTLMTGSEIADFSTSLISNFTSLTLSTELP